MLVGKVGDDQFVVVDMKGLPWTLGGELGALLVALRLGQTGQVRPREACGEVGGVGTTHYLNYDATFPWCIYPFSN